MAHSCTSRRILMLLSGVCTVSSVIMLAIALSTDHWVLTTQIVKPAEDAVNETATVTHVNVGLWRTCTRTNNNQLNCTHIKLFPTDQDSNNGSEDQILAIVRASSAFPILSLVLQSLAMITYFLGHSKKNKIHLSVVAGVLSVLAGLCSIVGLLIYISGVSDEYGSKTRPESAYSDQKFFYQYSWSFFLAVSSFIMTELAGVLLIYLYISRHRHMIKKQAESRNHLDEYPRLRQRSWSGSKSQDLCQALTHNQIDYSASELHSCNLTTDNPTDISMSLLNSTEHKYSPKISMSKIGGRNSRPRTFETIRKTTPV